MTRDVTERVPYHLPLAGEIPHAVYKVSSGADMGLVGACPPERVARSSHRPRIDVLDATGPWRLRPGASKTGQFASVPASQAQSMQCSSSASTVNEYREGRERKQKDKGKKEGRRTARSGNQTSRQATGTPLAWCPTWDPLMTSSGIQHS